MSFASGYILFLITIHLISFIMTWKNHKYESYECEENIIGEIIVIILFSPLYISVLLGL